MATSTRWLDADALASSSRPFYHASGSRMGQSSLSSSPRPVQNQPVSQSSSTSVVFSSRRRSFCPRRTRAAGGRATVCRRRLRNLRQRGQIVSLCTSVDYLPIVDQAASAADERHLTLRCSTTIVPLKTFIVEKLAAGRLPPCRSKSRWRSGVTTAAASFPRSCRKPPRRLISRPASACRSSPASSAVHQGVRTNMCIKVQCGDRLLRESCERVTVSPATSRRSDSEDNRWLPCSSSLATRPC